MTTRRSEAIWIASRNYWQIKVQKDGTRRGFTSSTPGRRGKHEAEAKADEWLLSGTAEQKLSQAWRAFLSYQSDHNAEATLRKHEQLGRLYLLPRLPDLRLSAITPARWQSCIDAAAKAGLSRRTCENIRGTITAFARFCRMSRWELPRIEEGDLTIPRAATPKLEKRVLSPDDLRTIFTDPTIVHYGKRKPSHYIHAFRFMILTGLRRGELCGLKNEDIVDGTLTIRRSINTLGIETRGKNDNARRSFRLSQLQQNVLRDQAAMLREKNMVSPWLFPDEWGERPDPNVVYDRWRTYREQHGIASSLHELRHTFISVNKADLPIELMKQVVGHSKMMDTFGVYGHETAGDRERAADIIDATFLRLLG